MEKFKKMYNDIIDMSATLTHTINNLEIIKNDLQSEKEIEGINEKIRNLEEIYEKTINIEELLYTYINQ